MEGLRAKSLGGARLSDRGGVLHPRAARAVEPDLEPARQPLRHDRHDDRGGDDAGHACARESCKTFARTLIRAKFGRFSTGRQLGEILAAIGIGAAIGIVTARRIAMTAMPQLVAAFHSLVGLAAVLVAAAAFLNPLAFGIADMVHPMIGQPFLDHQVSRIEMGLGVAIGAITFSGSVIAFLKLNGNMGGKPIMLPGRHVINLAMLAGILGLIAYFTQDQSPWIFWTITGLSFAIGFLLIIPIGGADMPVVVSHAQQLFGLGGGGDGVHAPQHRDDHHRRVGRIVGRDPQSYIMCRAMNRSFISVIAGGFGGDSGGGGGEAKRATGRGSADRPRTPPS